MIHNTALFYNRALISRAENFLKNAKIEPEFSSEIKDEDDFEMANVFAMLDEPDEAKHLTQKSFSFVSVFDGVELCVPDQLNFEQQETQTQKGV